MSRLRTEFPFVLPKGLLDVHGELHRAGTMRLATARDELEPLRDPSIEGADDPRLALLVLARVITALGAHGTVTADELTELYAADLAHLQDVYRIINYGSTHELDELLDVTYGRVEADRATPAPLALQPDLPAPSVAPPSTAAHEPARAPDASQAAADVTEVPADGVVPATRDTPPLTDPGVPAAPRAAATETASGRPSPTPVSDAARSLLRTPEPASSDAAVPTGDAASTSTDHHLTPGPAPAPSGSRRGRIEEVGRSTGRPGGV